MNAICAICKKPYDARHATRSRFCSAACRSKHARQRTERQRELLAQQTEAIIHGADPAVIHALAERARRLLSSSV